MKRISSWGPPEHACPPTSLQLATAHPATPHTAQHSANPSTCLCGIVILGTLVYEIIYVLTRRNVAGRWGSSIKELSSGW